MCQNSTSPFLNIRIPKFDNQKILCLCHCAYAENFINSRLIFSQDGNQRALTVKKWTYYLYDNLDRLTQQGECVDKVTSSNVTVHIRNFYDDYVAFRTAIGGNANYPDDTSKYSKGSLTGSIITVLGGSTPIWRGYYYDAKGRITKTVENNLLSGFDITTTAYTFTNKPATVTHTHTSSAKINRKEESIYTYTYDYADRVSKVEHTLNGTKVTLADNTYDNWGRLSGKSLHGSATNKLTYAYNIRNWLTGITGTKFNQNLYYADGVNATKCYNGNISSMTWKAGGESTVRGYKLTYDGLNRLATATYGETAAINTNLDRFTEKISGYDKNGNITALQRYGQTSASAYGLIDNLSFTLSGNQLNRVDDAVVASAYNNAFEFKDAVKQAGEYAYDAGNITKDLNKGITGIQYNVLNLPSSITFSDGSTITYTYSADGIKLRTVHKIGATTITTDYCSNVIYENGIQKMLLTEEGYVNLTGTQQYHYYLKDHQGNNRVVINQVGTAEETNHYYPFGGVFASTNVQPYKYNGKELDMKKGLNWYDYGARHYDAVLGRFMMGDPLAEKYYRISSYGYCANNPIRFIDTDGRKIVDAQGRIIYSKSGGWSEGAPDDAIRIGNSMMQTNMGTTQFNKMVDANYGITLNISQETQITRTSKSNTYLLGQAKKKTDINKKIKSVDIIVYEGTLNEFLKAGTRKAKRYRASTKSNEEAIGAIAAHESVHATDDENIESSIENKTEGTSHDVEKKPNEVENEILRELFNINHEP